MNPKKASHEIFLKYQIKSIRSIPMAATPAALPMINILPPVPAEKAIKCQSCASIGSLYIPMVAATRGTLSIMADKKPIMMITIF